MVTRRALLNGAVGLVGGVAFASLTPAFMQKAGARQALTPRPELAPGKLHEWQIIAQEQSIRLLDPTRAPSKVWTYGPDLLPVHRIKLGDTIRAELINQLPEHTTIHWHGVRVPNNMDGVQYVTQPPIEPGQSFTYEITPPDTGTFFFHPHCNEPGQVGRGLAGILIVEGDEQTQSDADIVMVVKDWRLAENGDWLEFDTNAGASRAGTYGTERSVNQVSSFSENIPAHGDIRLRVLNLDSTRQIQVGVEDADAYVIAIDGNPVAPFALETWRLGPAMRVDILVRAREAGSSFALNDYFAAKPYRLGHFTSIASEVVAREFQPLGLYEAQIPRVDPALAERIKFDFSAAAGSAVAMVDELPDDHPLKDVLLDSLCIGNQTLWAINKQTWPGGDHRNLPPPLAQLQEGRSYIFELNNLTPHPHPIHLHGHTFEVLSSLLQKYPRFLADTVLLQPRDRIEIGFVARSGNWMLHCHVLEHMETGMMGWLKVT